MSARIWKVLSIRQPWAWLILHGGKDVENRNWATKVRGRVLIHAGSTMTRGMAMVSALFTLPALAPVGKRKANRRGLGRQGRSPH